jgi:uncharacterized damage-inducible protein DinB
MKDFYRELFTYSNYINNKLIGLFITNAGSIPDKAHLLLCHILNTHRVWNNRIERDSTDPGIWETHPIEKLQAMEQENFNRSLAILEKCDMEQTIHYTNSSGNHWDNTIQDILFHMVNHSTHHRAQISSVLKEAGIEPLITDYIFYKRKSI